MPITTTINVTQTLHEVLIKNGGAVSVTVKITAPSFPDRFVSYEITQEEAVPFWGLTASQEVSRWEDLCGLLYSILIERGDLAGTLS